MQTNKTSVKTIKSLNIDKITLTNLKTDKLTKRLSAGIMDEDTRSSLYIQTPDLVAPFGVSSYDGGNGKSSQEDSKTWSLVLKASGGQNENIEEINILIKFLKDLDEKAIDYAMNNSYSIFKKKYESSQRAVVTDLLYNRCVKPSISSDGTVYPDKITLKIMKNDKMLPDVLVFKNSAEPLEISSWEMLQSLVPKGTPLKAIIQPKAYFVNGKMGINFRVLQIKLPNFEKIGRPVMYAFSEAPTLNDNNNNNVYDSTKENNTTKPSAAIVDNNNFDSEDSEVEVEDN